MSRVLGCQYTSGSRQAIRLTADLDPGWHDLGREWGFDDGGFLNFEIGARFQCRLGCVARSPETWQARTEFPASDDRTRLRAGSNLAAVLRANLIVDVPLDQ